jgi:hypothetical protein
VRTSVVNLIGVALRAQDRKYLLAVVTPAQTKESLLLMSSIRTKPSLRS